MKSAIENATITSQGFGQGWVEISSLPDNANPADGDDTIKLTLVNIEEERIFKSQLNTRKDISNPGKIISANPDIKLNVYILASAFFSDYPEALKRISYVVRVMQHKNVFTLQDINNMPGVDNTQPPFLDQVIFDLHSQTLDQQYQFSQSYGSRQIPSVIYKARLLVVDELLEPQEVPAITAIGFNTHRL